MLLINQLRQKQKLFLDYLKNASRQNTRGPLQHTFKTFQRAEKCNVMAQWFCFPIWLEQSTASPAMMEPKVSALQVGTGWLVRVERGTHFHQLLSQPYHTPSRSSQIKKAFGLNGFIKHYNSKLPLCEGLGGFPDNPGKYGNKQDCQSKNIMPDLKQLRKITAA